MRPRVAAAALVALVAAGSPAGAAPPPRAWTVTVSGRAGEVASLSLPWTVRLAATGEDTPVASAAPWAGVALVRLDGPATRNTRDAYLHYALRDALLCPGSRCEPPASEQPTRATDDDGDGTGDLTAGRYGVALLGPAGAPVTATLHLRGARRGGRTALRTTRRAASYSAVTFDPLVEHAGSALVSRGFARFDAPGRHVVTSLALAFVLDAPAVVHHAFCVAVAGSRTFDGIGGAVPCADPTGVGPLFGPSASVSGPGGTVHVAHLSGSGRTVGDFGVGYEAQVAGADGQVRALQFALVF